MCGYISNWLNARRKILAGDIRKIFVPDGTYPMALIPERSSVTIGALSARCWLVLYHYATYGYSLLLFSGRIAMGWYSEEHSQEGLRNQNRTTSSIVNICHKNLTI